MDKKKKSLLPLIGNIDITNCVYIRRIRSLSHVNLVLTIGFIYECRIYTIINNISNLLSSYIKERSKLIGISFLVLMLGRMFK